MKKQLKAMTTYQRGYRKALLDVAEKLNNAEANGYTSLAWDELIDQLAELGGEVNFDIGTDLVTHDELLKAGR